ncbi:MAG: PQQ-binding-like beta-propeller repeat protein [Anaerolineae bacterium]|nr:PQQ-binding-like beta-propeller repeat protein [Anaerolineae bacterium]
MAIWRNLVHRPKTRVHRTAGLPSWRLSVVLLVLVLVSGCAGGVRYQSWPGLLESDGTLYAASLEHIQALNSETGKVYWSFPSDEEKDAGPFYSAPALAPDVADNGLLVVAGFKSQTVYGLALGASPAERPDELWRFQGAAGQYVGTGTVAGDLFIIGNGDGTVYALSLEDGAKVWEYATEDRVWAKPLVIDDRVYVASLDHFLYVLDLNSGAELWRFEAEGSISATPLFAGGDVWIGDFASKLYQIDLKAQDAVWTFEANDWLWATPIESDGILYFADVGGNVYALNISDHTMVWDAPASVGDVVHGRPALSPDGDLLYVAGFERGGVHAIDTVTGNVRSSWGTVQESPGRLPGDLVTDGKRLYSMPIMVPARVQSFNLVSGDLLWTAPPAE